MNAPIEACRYWGRKIGLRRYLWRMLTRQVAKRLEQRDLNVVLANGRTLTLPRWSAFSSVVWVTNGQAEDGCEEVLECFGRRGSWFCDVGAHFGYWGVRMAHVSTGILYVEPNPRCHEALARNASAAGRHRIARVALGDKEGVLPFIADESAPLSRLQGPAGGPSPNGRTISVLVATLDRIWRDSGRPRVWGMKIDVEGGEAAVLTGGNELLRTCRPVVLVESSLRRMESIKPLLDGLGYTLGWLTERRLGKPQCLRVAGNAAEPPADGMYLLLPPGFEDLPGAALARRLFP